MRHGHKPEDHALVRGPALERTTPGARPPQTYDCSCGATMPGTSRREAAKAHKQHRVGRTTKRHATAPGRSVTPPQ
jgi:hypothetical protein